MKRRTALQALALPAALSACGGGGSPRLSIDLLGDSTVSGELQAGYQPYTRLPKTISTIIYELTGRPVFDHSRSGWKIGEALDGTPGFGKLRDHLRDTPSSTIILAFGGADAIDPGRETPPDVFERRLADAVHLCDDFGVTPILYCTYAHPAYIAKLAAIRERALKVACDLGVSVCDLWNTPVGLGDPVHPNQDSAYVIAQQFVAAINRRPEVCAHRPLGA